jgi:hypothetical protein
MTDSTTLLGAQTAPEGAETSQESTQSEEIKATLSPGVNPNHQNSEDMVNASPVVNLVSEEEAKAAQEEGIPDPQEVVEVEEWWWDEGVKGEGTPPADYNKSTFGTVVDQIKAQVELRKKLGGFTGAPEKGYEVPTIEGVEINTEDPMLLEFAEKAQKMNMSQDKFDEYVSWWIGKQQSAIAEKQEETLEQKKAQVEEQLAALGDGAAQKLNNLQQWGDNNLPEELHAAFRTCITNADQAKVFMALQERFAPTPIKVAPPSSPVTETQILERMRDPRYRTEDHFRLETDQMAKIVWPG